MAGVELKTVNGSYQVAFSISRPVCLITAIALSTLAWVVSQFYAPKAARFIVPILGVTAIGYLVYSMLSHGSSNRNMDDDRRSDDNKFGNRSGRATTPKVNDTHRVPDPRAEHDRSDGNRFGHRAAGDRRVPSPSDRPHDRSDDNKFGNRRR